MYNEHRHLTFCITVLIFACVKHLLCLKLGSINVLYNDLSKQLTNSTNNGFITVHHVRGHSVPRKCCRKIKRKCLTTAATTTHLMALYLGQPG